MKIITTPEPYRGQESDVSAAPYPFVDANAFLSEVEPDFSVENDRQPEVNQYDD